MYEEVESKTCEMLRKQTVAIKTKKSKSLNSVGEMEAVIEMLDELISAKKAIENTKIGSKNLIVKMLK